MAEQPLILFVGTYSDVKDAEIDYKNVLGLHKEGELGHVVAAILNKDEKGNLAIHRHNTSTTKYALGGALLGGLIGLAIPPLGVFVLAGGSIVGGLAAGGAIDAGVIAGVGGVMGHYADTIPKQELRELGDALEEGEAALVVVAVRKQQSDIARSTTRAVKKVIKVLDQGEVEAAYNEAVEAATKST